MSARLRILLAGGARPELRLAARQARDLGALVEVAASVGEAVECLRAHGADLVMAEVALDVPALMRALRSERIGVPVLACGVDAPAADAVAAVRAGASDYVPLPPSRDLIAEVLLSIGEQRTAVLGRDPALLAAVAHAERFAAAKVPILIRGEPGTGKEVLARHVHQRSDRVGPFVVVEAAGVDEELLKSELFGHAVGDFPGAVAARTGRFFEAASGTLLIRNVDALGPALQARLVDCLDRGTTRLMATTSADLSARRVAGQFRADLLTRLCTIVVDLPPLRERTGDIPELAQSFADQFSARHELPARRFGTAALELLASRAWPGNVRELEQVVHRAVLLARRLTVEPCDLVLDNGEPLQPAAPAAASGSVGSLVGRRVEDVERELILQTLRRCGGNRTTASGILGISVRTMRNKLKSFQQAGYAIARAL